MCGILGFFSSSFHNLKWENFHTALAKLNHRGPDEEGIRKGRNYIIGTKRLKIIDLNTGKQPIHNETKDIWISYNGEIYNYRELKAYLEKKGHKFYSKTDTEVIVHLYEEYKSDCLRFLEGMFAFALIDEKENLCFLARDRFGMKPLYYSVSFKGIYFSSETKPLLILLEEKPEIDIVALNFYLTYNYIPSPLSIYQNIHKLKAGHYILFKNSNFELKKYYQLQNTNLHINFSQAKDILDKLLNKAITSHLVCDVPLGVFLSGGLDSSILSWKIKNIMKKNFPTFTIGFKEKSYDETKYALISSTYLGLENWRKIFSEDELLKSIFLLPSLIDEPFGDLAFLPTYLLAKIAREKVKVVLSGDGADEIFAGYQTYIAHNIYRLFSMIPNLLRKNIIAKIIQHLPISYRYFSLEFCLKKFIQGDIKDDIQRHLKWMSIFDRERTFILKDEFQREIKIKFNDLESVNDWLKKIQLFDIITYLEGDILYKTDRATMLNSLEARLPYLDHKLVEFVLNLPSTLKLRNYRNTKYILRMSYYKNLPQSIIRRKKKGFTLPISAWIKAQPEIFFNCIRESKNPYFKKEKVTAMLVKHQNGKMDYGRQLWNIIVFSLWYERNY